MNAASAKIASAITEQISLLVLIVEKLSTEEENSFVQTKHSHMEITPKLVKTVLTTPQHTTSVVAAASNTTQTPSQKVPVCHLNH